METKNEWAGVGTANSVLATSDNSIIVLYKGEPGNQPTINLPGTDDMYSVWWFDPRKGGQMKRGRPLMVKVEATYRLARCHIHPTMTGLPCYVASRVPTTRETSATVVSNTIILEKL